MKKNVLAALTAIHRYGLDNSSWNIEENIVHGDYYGVVGRAHNLLPPHIAIYHDADIAESGLYEKCDYAVQTKELGTIYIYEL